MAAGSGSAPEGLLPRRESLWLGEGWSFDRLRMVHGELVELSPLPFIPSHEGRGVSYGRLSRMLEINSQTYTCKNPNKS